MQIYYERDANPLFLNNQRIAVLGYGNIGRPMALNLRDSDLSIIVGNVNDSYADQARREQFSVTSISDAVRNSTILFLAMPDEVLPRIYLEQIAPELKPDDLLILPSGYNLAYELIEPPPFVRVGMIAPRMLAGQLRQAYVSGRGFPSFVGLRRPNPSALDRLLAFALAVGALKQGAIEMTFMQEVVLDLFLQQGLLPAIHSLLLTATQVLLEAGYSHEAALTELYLSGELGVFFTQAAQQGLVATLEGMSLTGQYGVLTQTERFQESKSKYQMESILESLENGQFARAWADEFTDGYPRLKRLRDRLQQTALWQHEDDVVTIKYGNTT